jgi:hypothetical protein
VHWSWLAGESTRPINPATNKENTPFAKNVWACKQTQQAVNEKPVAGLSPQGEDDAVPPGFDSQFP